MVTPDGDNAQNFDCDLILRFFPGISVGSLDLTLIFNVDYRNKMRVT